MEHLISAWPEVLEQLRDAKHILLLSDYDGTLTPIVERPELADISESIRRLLQALVLQKRLTLGIISGRALADLKNRLNIRGAIYAGNHGLEIEGPGLNFVNPLANEIRPLFRIISQLLTLALETTKGVFVENKGLTLSVHYRQMASDNTQDIKYIFKRIINSAPAYRKFKITPGKKVYELRPGVEWDKGKAIGLLIKKYGTRGGRRNGLLPIYLGDDLTDEDGFKFISKYRNGISVYVGDNPNKTTASYFLNSPDEVTEFLIMILKYLQRDFK